METTTLTKIYSM